MSLVETSVPVIKLSELEHGQEAICFAALARKETGIDKHGNPFVKCHFRDKRITMVAPLWSSNAYREAAESWTEGEPYRLRVKGKHDVRFGFQLDLLEIRTIVEEDAADGYDFYELVESSQYSSDDLRHKIDSLIERYIEPGSLRTLVRLILDDSRDLFYKMPAAQNLHHGYTGGLAEHVWSMTRIGGFLAEHYSKYYYDLNPPLNKGVVVAACILHDIGKLRELKYHPVDTKYTVPGKLIGHVLMGRDLVRDTARRLGEFPEETLLLLEHAILAHHGKEEFGAPKAPQTIEALLVHHADDLDAKINMAACQLRKAGNGDDPFTEKIWGLGRGLYKGIPVPPPIDEDDLNGTF